MHRHSVGHGAISLPTNRYQTAYHCRRIQRCSSPTVRKVAASIVRFARNEPKAVREVTGVKKEQAEQLTLVSLNPEPVISCSKDLSSALLEFTSPSTLILVSCASLLTLALPHDVPTVQWAIQHKLQHLIWSQRAYAAIKKGTRPSTTETLVPPAEYIPRPEVVKQLSSMLDGQDRQRGLYYQPLSGPSGVGKTAAVREVCSMVGPGVIYVEFEALKDSTDLDEAYQQIATRLAAALKIEDAAQAKNGKEAFDQVEAVLHKAAQMYKQQHHACLRLVLDNLEALTAAGGGQAIGKLQDVARHAASDNEMSILFVTSSVRVLEIMQRSSSAWLRLGQVFVMPELNRTAAAAYAAKQGVPQQYVQDLVELVGGNFVDISMHGDRLRRGNTWTSVKTAVFQVAERHYAFAGLLPGTQGKFSQQQKKQVLLALQKLLDAEGSTMSILHFTELLPLPGYSNYSWLQQLNIVHSYDGDMVVFAKRCLGVFLRECLLEEADDVCVDAA